MRRGLLWIGIAVLLAACAAPAPRVSDAEAQQLWELRLKALQALETWALSGRIGIQSPDRGWNATVHWRQYPAMYDLRVIAPLGGGTLQLRGDASGVTAQTSKGEVYTAADAETLLREQAGVALPVKSLRYWALGRPDPGEEAEQSLDGHGRLTRLRQDGWEITYVSYRSIGDLELPDKIVLENGQIQVRLVVDRWDLA